MPAIEITGLCLPLKPQKESLKIFVRDQLILPNISVIKCPFVNKVYAKKYFSPRFLHAGNWIKIAGRLDILKHPIRIEVPYLAAKIIS
ncbi:MAG: hypothetical protein KF746_12835 [Chitinophagaceae bacterium]|nr:hypothetical protein [Chitinophagaceae bacterium]